MEYRVDNHDDCVGCGEDGFLIRGFERTDSGLRAKIVMNERTEGWVGLPHGGIGMGAICELSSGLDNYPDDQKKLFPLSCDFRMGGVGVSIGDEVTLEVVTKDDGAEGAIWTSDRSQPYISGDISYGKDDREGIDLLKSYMPKNISEIEDNLIPLPYYKDCFVCGFDRKYPGLKRKFNLVDKRDDKVVVSLVGFSPEDDENFLWFKRGDILHPVAFLGLGDETMGWGGFFLSKNGGVSVRLGYNFLRDVKTTEKLVFFGRGERIKGDIEKRLMFWASGGAAVVKDDGSFEIVMTSSGQWLGVIALTHQMNEYLIPKELLERAYQIAGA